MQHYETRSSYEALSIKIYADHDLEKKGKAEETKGKKDAQVEVQGWFQVFMEL